MNNVALLFKNRFSSPSSMNFRAGEKFRLQGGKPRSGNEIGLLHDLSDWSYVGMYFINFSFIIGVNIYFK